MKKRKPEHDPLDEFCKAIVPTVLGRDERRELWALLNRIKLRTSNAEVASSAEVFSWERTNQYIDFCLDAYDNLRIAEEGLGPDVDPYLQRLSFVKLHGARLRAGLGPLMLDHLGQDLSRTLAPYSIRTLLQTLQLLDNGVDALSRQSPGRGPKPGGPRSQFVDSITFEFRAHFGFMPPATRSGSYARFAVTFMRLVGCRKPNCGHLVEKSVPKVQESYDIAEELFS